MTGSVCYSNASGERPKLAIHGQQFKNLKKSDEVETASYKDIVR